MRRSRGAKSLIVIGTLNDLTAVGPLLLYFIAGRGVTTPGSRSQTSISQVLCFLLRIPPYPVISRYRPPL